MLPSQHVRTTIMKATLSRTESWTLMALSAACLAVTANTFEGDGEPLIASLAFSGLAFAATYALVRWAAPAFVEAGRKGRDMSKTNAKEIPETMGAVAAVVYLLLLLVFKPFCYYSELVTVAPARMSSGVNRSGENGLVYSGENSHQLPLSKVGLSHQKQDVEATIADLHR
jgi:UDP-N-acetylglucosamine--dolichyl-phosphate N-acetylglucosaminephosphotransferase